MATDINTAEEDFNKQKIVSDYFTTNTMALMLPTMGSNTIDNTCFSVPDMAKYEFFLSGTVRVDMDTEEATEINLMQGDVNVLAQASYTTGTMLESELDRHFTLFYKGMNMSADDFSVVARVPGGGADVEIRDLQWGVRVYTEDYPLTSTAPTCAT